jgi:hypothetical protein
MRLNGVVLSQLSTRITLLIFSKLSTEDFSLWLREGTIVLRTFWRHMAWREKNGSGLKATGLILLHCSSRGRFPNFTEANK